MNGSLSDIHAAELVLNIYESGLSGRLRFTQNKIRRDIYFRKGDIIFAHSSLPEERFGEMLIKLGKITQDEFNSVVREVAEGRRLGDTLVQRGIITTMDLYVGLNYQVQHILYSVFDWDDGLYEFEEDIRSVQHEISVRVSTPNLVLRGVRNISNLNVLERALGEDQNRLVLPQGTPRIQRSDFDYQEETILSQVDGNSDLQTLRQSTKLSSLEFGRAMFSLLLSGMIGFTKAEYYKPAEDPRNWSLNLFKAKPEPPAPAPMVLPDDLQIPTRSQEQRPLDSFTPEELRDLIIFTHLKFQVATDEEVLNLTTGCTEEEIHRSYDYLTGIFHYCYYSADQFHDLKDTLKAIVDRLAQAHRNLTQVDGSSHAVELHSSEIALADEEQFTNEPYPEIEFSPTPVNAEDYPEVEQIKPPSVMKKVEVPAPVSVVKEEFHFEPTVMEAPAPVHAAKSHAVEEPKSAVTTSHDMTLKELKDALDKNPADLESLREFGKRLQKAGHAREGEQQLLRALEIEPQNVENHFALADFYQTQGLKLKAFRHLNIILQMDPDNEKALSVLGLPKRKSILFRIERRT
jgi:tetratricopeptide (TPR) repeat protein